MATYKVIQDIEAEDKLIGPLTLRQSIYAGIAAIGGYLSFVFVANRLSLLLTLTLPPTVFAAFFAFPWGRDQSTEIWALAKIRFYIKSRKRMWDQSGTKDLVTITAPKRQARMTTNQLTAPEVHSRLSALASTLDSRGWAVKNAYTIPPLVAQQPSDRLLDAASLPQEVPAAGEVVEADDILDSNNARAHQLDEMVSAAGASHKQALLEHMQQGTMPILPAPSGPPAADYWFVTNPVSLPPTVAPADDVSEAVASAELHKRHDNAGDQHLKNVHPLQPARTALPSTPPPTAPPAVTATPEPATIPVSPLAHRNDLNVSTIARIANGQDGGNEVVISLH